MNLQQSFKKRNKLQEEIVALRRMLSAEVLVTEYKEKENTLLLNGMTCKEWLALIEQKTYQLEKLVTAIDKANSTVKPLLSQLSIYKAQKAFYENVNYQISRTPTKRYYVERDKTIYYRTNVEQVDILNRVKELTQKIEVLEEKIQKLNGAIQVIVEE